MAEVIFFIAAIGAIAGAVGTVSLRNPFYSVLALVCHLLALAALFLLLRAEFVAAAQVIVYAGAVMVLYVFVVAYVGEGSELPLSPHGGASLRPLSLVFAGALLLELCIAILGSSIELLGEEGADWFRSSGRPRRSAALPDQVPARVRAGLAAAADRGGRRRDPRAPARRDRRGRAGGHLGGRRLPRAEPSGELPRGETETMAEAAGTAEHVP